MRYRYDPGLFVGAPNRFLHIPGIDLPPLQAEFALHTFHRSQWMNRSRSSVMRPGLPLGLHTDREIDAFEISLNQQGNRRVSIENQFRTETITCTAFGDGSVLLHQRMPDGNALLPMVFLMSSSYRNPDRYALVHEAEWWLAFLGRLEKPLSPADVQAGVDGLALYWQKQANESPQDHPALGAACGTILTAAALRHSVRHPGRARYEAAFTGRRLKRDGTWGPALIDIRPQDAPDGEVLDLAREVFDHPDFPVSHQSQGGGSCPFPEPGRANGSAQGRALVKHAFTLEGEASSHQAIRAMAALVALARSGNPNLTR